MPTKKTDATGEVKPGFEREFNRTDDKLPVYYEIWDGKHDVEEASWEILFDDLEPKPEENPKLYEVLFDINQKLNMLMNFLADKQGFNLPEAREVNMSGGGVRFYCGDTFKIGDHLVLKTFLPIYAHVVKIKCEVVRFQPGADGNNEVAVKYVDMDEATREKIIRYLFAKQRKSLRTDRTSGD